MSEENVEVVRAAIDAYNRGDRETVLAGAAPGFEFDVSRAAGPLRGVYGVEELRGFWSELAESWESVRIEPHEFLEVGEHVVVPWTLHAVGRDGIEVQSRVTWTWTVREGAIARICMYQDRQDALDAAMR